MTADDDAELHFGYQTMDAFLSTEPTLEEKALMASICKILAGKRLCYAGEQSEQDDCMINIQGSIIRMIEELMTMRGITWNDALEAYYAVSSRIPLDLPGRKITEC